MALVFTETCLYCGEHFVCSWPGRNMCTPCERARDACARFGHGEVADQWIAFVYGAETLRRGRLRPYILRSSETT